MKNRELIKKLQELSLDLEVIVPDVVNDPQFREPNVRLVSLGIGTKNAVAI